MHLVRPFRLFVCEQRDGPWLQTLSFAEAHSSALAVVEFVAMLPLALQVMLYAQNITQTWADVLVGESTQGQQTEAEGQAGRTDSDGIIDQPSLTTVGSLSLDAAAQEPTLTMVRTHTKHDAPHAARPVARPVAAALRRSPPPPSVSVPLVRPPPRPAAQESTLTRTVRWESVCPSDCRSSAQHGQNRRRRMRLGGLRCGRVASAVRSTCPRPSPVAPCGHAPPMGGARLGLVRWQLGRPLRVRSTLCSDAHPARLSLLAAAVAVGAFC